MIMQSINEKIPLSGKVMKAYFTRYQVSSSMYLYDDKEHSNDSSGIILVADQKEAVVMLEEYHRMHQEATKISILSCEEFTKEDYLKCKAENDGKNPVRLYLRNDRNCVFAVYSTWNHCVTLNNLYGIEKTDILYISDYSSIQNSPYEIVDTLFYDCCINPVTYRKAYWLSPECIKDENFMDVIDHIQYAYTMILIDGRDVRISELKALVKKLQEYSGDLSRKDIFRGSVFVYDDEGVYNVNITRMMDEILMRKCIMNTDKN